MDVLAGLLWLISVMLQGIWAALCTALLLPFNLKGT